MLELSLGQTLLPSFHSGFSSAKYLSPLANSFTPPWSSPLFSHEKFLSLFLPFLDSSPPALPGPGTSCSQIQTLTGLGWGLHSPPSSMGLMKTIITCFVALLGVTNWLILRRLFEDEKLGITHGAEGMHLPQLGPESAAVTSHLQGSWVSWLGPHSRSGLASRRGVKSICSTHHQGQTKRPGKSVLCCAMLCGPAQVWRLCLIGICMV